jgi:large subunit ribosomal protein L22
MAEEKKDKKQDKAPDEAAEAPKRRRTSGARKAEKAPPAEKPARRPARAKQGAGAPKAQAKDKPAGEEAQQAKAEKPAGAKPAARSPKAPAKRRRAASEETPKPAARRPEPARPVVTARAKYVRSSARKARLVLEHVRGKSIADARAILRHSPRGVARDLERLLNSAIANAENNHDLVGDDLLVKEVYADEGPTLKRFRPRAQGRAYRIRKRTSHLTMRLTPKE